jgi:hypothetical protein
VHTWEERKGARANQHVPRCGCQGGRRTGGSQPQAEGEKGGAQEKKPTKAKGKEKSRLKGSLYLLFATVCSFNWQKAFGPRSGAPELAYAGHSFSGFSCCSPFFAALAWAFTSDHTDGSSHACKDQAAIVKNQVAPSDLTQPFDRCRGSPSKAPHSARHRGSPCESSAAQSPSPAIQQPLSIPQVTHACTAFRMASAPFAVVPLPCLLSP